MSPDEAAAERQYDAWAELVWQGRVADVIDELATPGAESMLRVRAASLSDDRPLDAYFTRRARQATGTRRYRRKPLAVDA